MKQSFSRCGWHAATASDVDLCKVSNKVELLQQVFLVIHALADDVAHEQTAICISACATSPCHGEPEKLEDHDLSVHEILSQVHVVVWLLTLGDLHFWLAEAFCFIRDQSIHHPGRHAAEPPVRYREGSAHTMCALEEHFEVVVEQREKLIPVLLLDVVRQGEQPRVHDRLPAQVRVRLQEHDAHTGHSRWRGIVQVPNLEQHRSHRRQLNDLATVQAQFLVVVKHGVHVLDPDGIHGPIKNRPLVVIVLLGLESTHDPASKAVCPLLG
mmetsp:Transcript_7569/g.17978  ORF Transcript_7569/g.17978 Transcript_7569/m.17978 type:complete len:269 (+) Transcript_7569:5018-5824(+)